MYEEKWADIILYVLELTIMLATFFYCSRLRIINNNLLDYVGISRHVISEQAMRDSLTGLPNGKSLTARLDEAIEIVDLQGGHTQLGVIFIGLDEFRVINDALGYELGDKLLLAVRSRLFAKIDHYEVLGRVAGDQFVILSYSSATDLDYLKEIGQLMLCCLRQPFFIGGYEVDVTASAGIAIYSSGGACGAGLIKKASAAMCRSKKLGGDCLSVFDASMDCKAFERFEVLQGLRIALKDEQFELFYQPKFGAIKGQLVGAEALLRWNHPERGLIMPRDFMEIAESSNLMIAIGDWVLNEACRQMSIWRLENAVDWGVAVNVSAHQLVREDFVKKVESILNLHRLPAPLLILEITETAAVADYDKANEALQLLSSIGVGIAIDDFGTGYSCINHIKNLPLAELKIDCDFVNDIEFDIKGRIIVGAIVAIGKALRVRVVAEGVETLFQKNELARMGCDVLQGFYLGKPVPADEFTAKFNGGVLF